MSDEEARISDMQSPGGAQSPGETADSADSADHVVVRAAAEVAPGERLTIRFAEDHLTVSADHE
jgi:hypothetical protein